MDLEIDSDDNASSVDSIYGEEYDTNDVEYAAEPSEFDMADSLRWTSQDKSNALFSLETGIKAFNSKQTLVLALLAHSIDIFLKQENGLKIMVQGKAGMLKQS